MSIITELLQTAAGKLGTKVPRQVTVRDLSRQTSSVLTAIQAENTSALITYRGVPRYIIAPIDPDQLTSLILAGSPGIFADAVREGEEALKEGKVEAPPESVRV